MFFGPLFDDERSLHQWWCSKIKLLDLASPDRCWIVFHDRSKKVCPLNICPSYYIFDNADLYSRLSSDVDQIVCLLLNTDILAPYLGILLGQGKKADS
jgi:hypothetical protein